MDTPTTPTGPETVANNEPLGSLAAADGSAPSSQPCAKCGSLNIHRRYRKEGDHWNAAWGDEPRETDFIKRDRFDGRAKRECITHHCRCCQYEWETPTLQNNPVRHGGAQPRSCL